MSVIYIIFCSISAVAAFRYITYGLAFLIVTNCIITIPFDFSSIKIGFATIAAQDFVIIALFLRSFIAIAARQVNTAEILPVLTLIFFIIVGSTKGFLLDHGKMVSFYRTAIGIGCYYAVFICTQIISAERIKYLIYVTVITSLICIALQSYLISTKNADLIIKFTPWYQNPVNAELLRTNFLANQMPRVFPNGTTAIAMLSGFSLVKALTAKKTKSILIYAALYGVFTLFLMSTGTRGFVFASVVTLSYALFAVRNQIKLSRKFALMLMTPILGLGLIYFILTSDLFGTLMARTEQLQAAKYQDAGFLSKIYQANVALRIIMENPFGIGLTRPIELEHHLRDSMWDTNSFLVMGFVGGLPAMISLIWFLISIYKKYRANLIKSTGDNAVDLIACSAALLYIFIMTAASFVFTFTTTEAIIQLCLFAGFVCKNRLSQKLTIQRLKLNKNLARSPS